MKKHLFSYGYDGGKWSIAVMAEDQRDARARLLAASRGAYDGILMAEIPAYVPLGGFFTRAAVWLRNIFS